jgi:hypothetical protein
MVVDDRRMLLLSILYQLVRGLLGLTVVPARREATPPARSGVSRSWSDRRSTVLRSCIHRGPRGPDTGPTLSVGVPANSFTEWCAAMKARLLRARREPLMWTTGYSPSDMPITRCARCRSATPTWRWCSTRPTRHTPPSSGNSSQRHRGCHALSLTRVTDLPPDIHVTLQP